VQVKFLLAFFAERRSGIGSYSPSTWIISNSFNKYRLKTLSLHNLDIIKNADYLIDIGPEAGSRGGEIVCMGMPEEVAEHPTSYTAEYLKPLLK